MTCFHRVHSKIAAGIVLWWLLGLWPQLMMAEVLTQSFSDTLAGFEISSPNEKWKLTPQGSSPGVVRATLRYESSIHQFVPNVTVQVLPVTGNQLSLEKLVEADLKNLPETAKVLDKKRIKHQNQTGYQIILEEQQNKLRFLQWVFLNKDKTYIITCSSKIASFKHLEEDFKKILSSFKFILSTK